MLILKLPSKIAPQKKQGVWKPDSCYFTEREVDLAFWESDYVIEWEDASRFSYQESIYPALFSKSVVTEEHLGLLGKLTYPHLGKIDYFLLHKEDQRKYKVCLYADRSCEKLSDT